MGCLPGFPGKATPTTEWLTQGELGIWVRRKLLLRGVHLLLHGLDLVLPAPDLLVDARRLELRELLRHLAAEPSLPTVRRRLGDTFVVFCIDAAPLTKLRRRQKIDM